ncbi:hypothetical protein B7M42_22100 [Salmonella enterica subsp. enterica serovar Newport]|nr:hypothetical protein [Salmonella enterica subsp. enterica serovar Newport]
MGYKGNKWGSDLAGFGTFPGGSRDVKDLASFEKTVKRETKEELGINIDTFEIDEETYSFIDRDTSLKYYFYKTDRDTLLQICHMAKGSISNIKKHERVEINDVEIIQLDYGLQKYFDHPLLNWHRKAINELHSRVQGRVSTVIRP